MQRLSCYCHRSLAQMEKPHVSPSLGGQTYIGRYGTTLRGGLGTARVF